MRLLGHFEWSATMDNPHQRSRYLRRTDPVLNFDQYFGLVLVCKSTNMQFESSNAEIPSAERPEASEKVGTTIAIGLM
jgi:hypothetical protein